MSFRAPDATLLSTAIFVVAGIAFGRGYFAALRYAVTLYCAGSGRLRATGLSLGRLAAAAGFFLLAARAGAWPLLGALLAFLVTRAFAIRSARRIA
jgi:N-ATPase, AtpR subunit